MKQTISRDFLHSEAARLRRIYFGHNTGGVADGGP